MNLDYEVIGAIVGATIAASWPAWQARKSAGRLEQRLGQPNGNEDDHRTIRQMLAQLMTQVNLMDDRLRIHDAKQRDNSARIEHVEQMVESLQASVQGD